MTLPGAVPADRAAQVFSGNDVNWTVDAVLAVDSRGIVRLTNWRAEQLFGHTREEMVGRPVESFVRAQVTAPGRSPTGLRKDGTEFPLQISLTSVATKDGHLLFATLSDARHGPSRSGRLAAPTRRAANKRAPRPDDSLTGEVAHDVYNHLAGIMIYSGLVCVGLKNQLGEGEVEGAEVLNGLIQDVGRIEALATSVAELLGRPPGEVGFDSAQLPKDVLASASETVLVVDDEAFVRDAAGRILAMNGYTVLEAPDGPSALAAALEHPGTIDLVLTDVGMPGGPAQGLTAQLAAVRPGTKVLTMTGFSREALVGQGFTADHAALLHKPFSADALLRAVRSTLGGGL